MLKPHAFHAQQVRPLQRLHLRQHICTMCTVMERVLLCLTRTAVLGRTVSLNDKLAETKQGRALKPK